MRDDQRTDSDDETTAWQPAGPPPPGASPSPSEPGPAAPPLPPAAPAPPPPAIPPSQGAWGAPPVFDAAGGPGLGTPPGWGPASPGGPVSWEPQRSGSSGCLKACLVVGLIGVALLVAGVVAAIIVGGRFITEIAENPDGFFGAPCEIASSLEVGDAVGEPVQLFELEGLMGGMMDALLDRRLLADAADCYAIGEHGFVARIAVDDGGGRAAFDEARATAEGLFLASDEQDIGDAAFCTSLSEAGSSGVLVRFGERVVYVSIADEDAFMPEPDCELAKAVARTLAP